MGGKFCVMLLAFILFFFFFKADGVMKMCVVLFFKLTYTG